MKDPGMSRQTFAQHIRVTRDQVDAYLREGMPHRRAKWIRIDADVATNWIADRERRLRAEVETMMAALRVGVDACACASRRLETAKTFLDLDGPVLAHGVIREMHNSHRVWCPQKASR